MASGAAVLETGVSCEPTHMRPCPGGILGYTSRPMASMAPLRRSGSDEA